MQLWLAFPELERADKHSSAAWGVGVGVVVGWVGFTLTDHEESRCQTHSGKTSHLVAKCGKQEWGGKDDGEENLQHWPAITLSNRVRIILTRMQFRKKNLVIFLFY